MNKLIKNVTMLGMALFVCGGVNEVKASEYSYLTEQVPIMLETPDTDNNGNLAITWFSTVSSIDENSSIVSYEVQISKNTNFANATTYTSKEEKVSVPKNYFGKQGGKYYTRIRTCVTPLEGEATYSGWSEKKELVNIAITKKNFPGMYKLLKNGGKVNTENGLEKQVYDVNGDNWLSPVEVENLVSISTISEVFNEETFMMEDVKTINVSSVKGIENLTNLTTIDLGKYSGKVMDLTNTNVDYVSVSKISAKEFKLIANKAENIFLNTKEKAKTKKIDVSKCKAVKHLSIFGTNSTKVIKLPKVKKNLKSLIINGFHGKKLNVNAYKNLWELNLIDCDTKNIKFNKCKNINYLYICGCDKLKKLDVSKHKSLKAVDVSYSENLSKDNVKVPKKTKLTWNKGMKWISTKKYLNGLYKNVYGRE